MCAKRLKIDRARLTFVDGAVAEPTPGEQHAINVAKIQGRRGVTIVSRGRTWRDAMDCLQNDGVLETILSEFVLTFDLKFAMDAAITEIVSEMATSEQSAPLARSLVRRVASDALVCYLMDVYRRFFTWAGLLGGVPHAYRCLADPEALDVAATSPRLYSRHDVRRRNERDESAFGALGASLTSDDKIARALRTVGRAPNWMAREIAVKLKGIEDRAERARMGLTALEVLKRFRDGHVPFVPRPDDAATVVLYDHTEGELVAVDRAGVVYRAFAWVSEAAAEVTADMEGGGAAPDDGLPDPRGVLSGGGGDDEKRPPRVVVASMIAAGAVESKIFRDMRCEFFHSVLINSRRSMVVAPDAASAQDAKRNDTMREYFTTLSEKYPHQLYSDMIKSSVAANQLTQLNVATGAMQTNPIPGLINSSTAVSTCDILERYEDHARRQILDELRFMVENYKQANASYGALTRFIDAYSANHSSRLPQLFQNLTEADRGRIDALVAAQTGAAAMSDRPTIHRLDDGSKLLSAYTSTVGISDVEELYHMWHLMWKSKMSAVSRYARRKNVIQYSGGHSSEMFGSRFIVMQFCRVVNTDLTVLKEPMEQHGVVTMNDIFIMDRCIEKTAGVRTLVAKNLALMTSDVNFKVIPPAEEESTATPGTPGISNAVK